MTPKQVAPQFRIWSRSFFLVKQSLKCFGVTTCSKWHVFPLITDTIWSNKFQKDVKNHKIKLFFPPFRWAGRQMLVFSGVLENIFIPGKSSCMAFKMALCSFPGNKQGRGNINYVVPEQHQHESQSCDITTERLVGWNDGLGTAISTMLHEQHQHSDTWYFFLMIPLTFHSAPWPGQNWICLLLAKKTDRLSCALC